MLPYSRMLSGNNSTLYSSRVRSSCNDCALAKLKPEVALRILCEVAVDTNCYPLEHEDCHRARISLDA